MDMTREILEQPVEEWRDVLRRAADLLKERGWFQGKDFNGDVDYREKMCASRAICAASPVVGLTEAHRRLIMALGGGANASHCCVIFDWNDAPERTAAEVIATLRAVAES